MTKLKKTTRKPKVDVSTTSAPSAPAMSSPIYLPKGVLDRGLDVLLGKEVVEVDDTSATTVSGIDNSPRAQLARSSLAEFSKYCFIEPSMEAEIAIDAGGFTANTAMHIELYSILDSDETEILFLAPRGSAKSTISSVIYPLYALGQNRNERIIIVSKVASNAQAFLSQIEHNMRYNQRYISLYGNMVPPPKTGEWKKDRKTILRDEPPGGMKDPSLLAVGTLGAIPSKRATIIIADDLLDDNNADTPVKRAKIKNWFGKSLAPVLAKNGRLIIVGTTWYPDDLYASLKELWIPKDPTYRLATDAVEAA